MITSHAYDCGYYDGSNGLEFDPIGKQGKRLTDYENGFNDGTNDRINTPVELPEDLEHEDYIDLQEWNQEWPEDYRF